ncbi:hypothetical protein, partial [Micromonospora sp. NPDC023644]|uniref:hypothetical protein n=1 Tax=Micromonospora sp. NPDC023644 TaxID=3154321 RepID=UPI0033F6DE56
FIISHRMPLKDAAKGYKIFQKKQDECTKVVPGPSRPPGPPFPAQTLRTTLVHSSCFFWKIL